MNDMNKTDENKTNKVVLNEVNKRKTMISTTIKRKINLIGNLLRHNQFIMIIEEGKVNGK